MAMQGNDVLIVGAGPTGLMLAGELALPAGSPSWRCRSIAGAR